jgi:hypothetical protein
MPVTAEKEADADMNITKDTKLKDLLAEYPWLKDEITKVNDKFKMLNTPMGKIMLGKADISEMSKKSGMDAQQIISKLTELIQGHQ